MTKNSIHKILFVRLNPSSFVQRDLEILKIHFQVREVDFILDRKDPLTTMKTVYSLIRGVIWADMTFSWFADIHAQWTVKLSHIFRRKSVVVIGGYETGKIEELGYGALLDPVKKKRIKYIFENADRIIALTSHMKEEAVKYYEITGDNFSIIPTGFDYHLFKSGGEKEDLVFTASLGHTWDRVRLKGVDTLVKAAKYLPEIRFVVNGTTGEALEKLKKIAPDNVEFVGPVPFKELLKLFQKSKVYCQLSMREGLPTAVCEAMLCECVPVGTKRFGIPVAIGDTGFYAGYGDVRETVAAIKKALKSDGVKARERVKSLFPREVREKGLLELIRKL
ncbi:MAG: glycosyltransferase [Methanobacteriaceae archaeon]|nr:glycosyltransferase [Methanobacteriaceae archaeon]